MTDKLFDDFVQSRLENYDSGAPMHVWERMQKEKDERKGFFFFRNRYLFLLGIGLLALTAIGFMTSQFFVQEKKNITTVSQKQNTYTAQSDAVQSSAAKKPNLNFATDEKNTSTVNDQQQVIEKNSTNVSAVMNPSTAGTLFTAQSISKNKVRKERKYQAIFSSTILQKKFAKNKINQSFSNTSAEKKKNTLTREPDENELNSGSSYKLNFAAYSPVQKKFPGFNPLALVNQLQTRPSCPTITGPKRNDLYLEFYVSPDYTVRSFSNEPGQANYIANRKGTEDNRNGFSTGIRIAKNLGEKTFFKAGINYSQINERLRIVAQNQKQITQIITIRTVIRAPGDTLFIRDTSYFEQTGTLYRTTYNRYRFIDIPVIFSYELGNPDLMSFTLNAGPVFNITSFYNGEVLDTALLPLKISTSAGKGPQHWRSNIGLGFFASVSIIKKLNERISVFGEPYLRYNFNSVTQKNTIVQQRYAITGMQLGIRYKLVNNRQRSR